MGDWSALVGAGVVSFILALLFAIGSVALSCWLLYAVIWRAVRRGLREYNGEMRSWSISEYLGLERRP